MCEQLKKDKAEWKLMVTRGKSDLADYFDERQQQCRGLMANFFFSQEAAEVADETSQKNNLSARFNLLSQRQELAEDLVDVRHNSSCQLFSFKDSVSS